MQLHIQLQTCGQILVPFTCLADLPSGCNQIPSATAAAAFAKDDG